MTPLVFWFDVISPYAWLAFDRLPQALEGLNYRVEYRPLVFGALLKTWGQKGPAEIAPKRTWTYRQIGWLAHRQGTPLQLPRPHPFNPLALQRLAVACCEPGGTPNRRTVERLFRHVWCRDGADPNELAALAALTEAMAPQQDPSGEAVKQALRAHTEAAAASGVFGVPTIEVVTTGRQFWGQDALPMLRASIEGDAWFDGPDWDAADQQPPGLQRPA